MPETRYVRTPSQSHLIKLELTSPLSDEAEKCISEFVLPLPTKDDVVPWTERLLLVMKYLNPGGVTKLLALTNLKSP
jgi:hypothetical protein